MQSPLPSHPTAIWRRSPELPVEAVALLASLYFSIACNVRFWSSALQDRALGDPGGALFALALFVALTALHFGLLCLLLNRWTAKPVLAALIVGTAFATFFMQKYGVYLDPGMLRNAFATDPAEAGDLLTLDLLPHLVLYAGLPLLLLRAVRLRARPWRRAVAVRALAIAAALAVFAGSLLPVSAEFSALMRNHREIRYLVTPSNYLYSLSRLASNQAVTPATAKAATGPDARPGARWSQHSKPVLLVLVVGETARAANWGLNGYTRQTTPQLAALDVKNFSSVTSCGTDTETSLPCLFSPHGRRSYDAQRIRSSESLLHVVQRAGFHVLWRSNQAGCKGVCDGFDTAYLTPERNPAACRGGDCLDGGLLDELVRGARDARGNMVLVLHQIGNHGPAYFRRYPEEFRRFTPTCDTPDLGKCTREQIVNSYDNALLYTDDLLARLIAELRDRVTTHDTAMIYLSDHGESLGEKGLYLHGVPRSIAPREQTQVPMVMWFSEGYRANFGLDADCMRSRARAAAAHDNLFHTVLGLLDIETTARTASLDLSAGCRRGS